MGSCGYFCEWVNEIKARKFVPQPLVIVFFTIKNTHNLIKLSLFHGVKKVNWQKIKNNPIKEKLLHVSYSY